MLFIVAIGLALGGRKMCESPSALPGEVETRSGEGEGVVGRRLLHRA